MNQFLEYLEGTFHNKVQAQSHPTRYAHIRVQHRKLSDYRFYGEQAYNYMLERPYRQFVIDVKIVDDEYYLRNFEIENPSRFVGCQNLELITDDILTYRDGCDIIMRKTGPEMFEGGTSTCECWVMWNGVKTYVQNEVILTRTEYHVTDKGLHAETHEKIWGSDYGSFKFVRLPD
jgi:CpeT protein